MTEKNNLYELIESIEHTQLTGGELKHTFIDEIKTDSRRVGENDLFIALAGDVSDGHSYVETVLQSGCGAVIVEKGSLQKDWLAETKIPICTVQSTRRALADLASKFYNYPEKKVKLVGITGTNGKTTVTYLLEEAMTHQGERVGVIGTVNYRFTDSNGGVHSFPAPFTTPDPLTLKKMLRLMVDAGVSIVLMEVSSHALVQRRLGNILFDCAAFTNLSHDHLDYHQSLEQYFQAKTLLFTTYLKNGGKAVVTHQDGGGNDLNEWASKITALLDAQDVSYIECGKSPICKIQPDRINVEIDRTEVMLKTPKEHLSFISPMVGRFNVDNMMTTIGIIEMMGYNSSQAAQSLAQTHGAPGRLERVFLNEKDTPKTVAFVDYAHTPDALLNVLKTLKTLPHKRLICVFGCGGDRDAEKRPEMGKIAAELADVAIVTDDNPRSENAHTIREEIITGILQKNMTEKSVEWLVKSTTGSGYVMIPDRREAIHCAVKSAGTEDIIVVAGKGHEKYQLTNQGKRYFDDALEVREALVSWDVKRIAKALGVTPEDALLNTHFTDISTDSRSIKPGQIFVALAGDNFDGHQYIGNAVQAGAGAFIIDRSKEIEVPENLPVFRVNDTLEALGNLAAFRRKQIGSISNPVIIGITGSCGKTTVKEMTSAILEQQWPNTADAPHDRVLKTTGNFNNLIGLPLSLLPLKLKHQAAVLEMGMNQPGEIARLTEIADPDISCIVNVHGAHLEGLGSIEGVARAKEEIFAATQSRGTLIVNLDDNLVTEAATRYPQKKIKYTTNKTETSSADIWSSNICSQESGNIAFNLHIGNSFYPVKLRVPGKHNVENCLAAASMATAVGIEPRVIVRGLESFEAADKRLQIVSATAGYSIINDTYNANPASMSAGLATLSSMSGSQKIAVLGDMLELGDLSVSAHTELGILAAQTGLAFLLVVGSFAEHIARGAASSGMARDTILVFENKDDIVTWIKEMEAHARFADDMWMLIKASRGMRLETVVAELT